MVNKILNGYVVFTEKEEPTSRDFTYLSVKDLFALWLNVCNNIYEKKRK